MFTVHPSHVPSGACAPWEGPEDSITWYRGPGAIDAAWSGGPSEIPASPPTNQSLFAAEPE